MQFSGLISLARRVPSRSSSRVGRGIEVLLMFLLAIQVARLLWALVAPMGAFGDWRPFEPAIPGPQARLVLFQAFDPFYRQAPASAGAGVQQVTSLSLRLYGIRINEGSGLGSAIIADETGKQTSYAVGEEVAPGVKLKAVAFDHVVLSRNDVDETLYIDQSGGAPVADVPAAPPPPGTVPTMMPSRDMPPPSAGEPLSAQSIQTGIAFAPRTANGSVTGLVVSPTGSGDIFARAGFRPGDIVAQVNGAPIRSTQDLVSLKDQLKPGARISLMVERGAATVPIAIIIPDNK